MCGSSCSGQFPLASFLAIFWTLFETVFEYLFWDLGSWKRLRQSQDKQAVLSVDQRTNLLAYQPAPAGKTNKLGLISLPTAGNLPNPYGRCFFTVQTTGPRWCSRFVPHQIGNLLTKCPAIEFQTSILTKYFCDSFTRFSARFVGQMFVQKMSAEIVFEKFDRNSNKLTQS